MKNSVFIWISFIFALILGVTFGIDYSKGLRGGIYYYLGGAIACVLIGIGLMIYGAVRNKNNTPPTDVYKG